MVRVAPGMEKGVREGSREKNNNHINHNKRNDRATVWCCDGCDYVLLWSVGGGALPALCGHCTRAHC